MRVRFAQFQPTVFGIVAFVGLVVAPTGAFATALPITDTGILQISNLSGSLLGLTATPTLCLNWGGGATCVGGTTHSMSVSGSSNLFLTPSTGTIQDVSGASSVSAFEKVSGAGALTGQTINFDLLSLVTNGGTAIGNCASNAPLNSCTPANSPFTISENITGTQLSLSFSALLKAYTGTAATGSTNYSAIFSTQMSGQFVGIGPCNGITANITDFLTCEAAGGSIQTTWSATEAPTGTTPSGTPEPASLVLIGSGLVAIAFRLRHRSG